jgi:hypothetical protein
VSESESGGVTVAYYNNFSEKTNMKQEILTSGNALAPFCITKMIPFHGTWTLLQLFLQLNCFQACLDSTVLYDSPVTVKLKFINLGRIFDTKLEEVMANWRK